LPPQWEKTLPTIEIPSTGELLDVEKLRQRFAQMDLLTRLQQSTRELKRWAIIGAGPVGLVLGLAVARVMARAHMCPEEAHVVVYEIRLEQGGDGQFNRPGPRRDQVVTLQDDVVDLFHSAGLGHLFEGERVWARSRNCAIADLEDRLLAFAQEDDDARRFLRLQRTKRRRNIQEQRDWILGLDADVLVGTDGAASPSRQAFPETFRSVDAPDQEFDRTRLGDKNVDCVPTDYALGIGLTDDVEPLQEQSANVFLTLSQCRYLLNSEQGKRGYLNIRITKEEYDQIFDATGRRGCTFGSPITLFQDALHALDVDPTANHNRIHRLTAPLPWLDRTIGDGLKLFNLTTDHVRDIVGIQLTPAYVHHYFHILPPCSGTNRPRILCLAGDSAISHHFWPGRGLNTGLKAASAIARMWCGDESDPWWGGCSNRLMLFQTFMVALRKREMQGRSQSMMWRRYQLAECCPWLNHMLQGEQAVQAQILADARDRDGQHMDELFTSAKTWADLLQPRHGWPHARLGDAALRNKLTRRARPSPLAMRTMVGSACVAPTPPSAGQQQLSGWPTFLQGGREVDPSNFVWM